jgi:uncharacterized Zn-binding protein involved in type VI secretion
MGRSVARLGDAVAVFEPPGCSFTGLANGVAGTPPAITAIAALPVTGTLVIPFSILGCIQAGSSKLTFGGLGAAHIGDPLMVPMPPVLQVAGPVLTGALTFAIPLQGTIDMGSSNFRADSRGLAHVGDSAMVFFQPSLPFVGTLSGQPFTGTVTIQSPVRGMIVGGAKYFLPS